MSLSASADALQWKPGPDRPAGVDRDLPGPVHRIWWSAGSPSAGGIVRGSKADLKIRQAQQAWPK
jgi:hypothetical protein